MQRTMGQKGHCSNSLEMRVIFSPQCAVLLECQPLHPMSVLVLEVFHLLLVHLHVVRQISTVSERNEAIASVL